MTSTEDLAEVVLKRVEERGSLDSYEFSREIGTDHQQVVGAIKSLQSAGDVSLN